VDKHLKERLVGAAVLVAAAVILIPEMLTGPHESVTEPAELLPGAPAEAGGVKTYTIDLSAAQRKDATIATESSVDAAPNLSTIADLSTIEVAPAPPPEEPVASRRQPVTASTPPSDAPVPERTRPTATAATGPAESATSSRPIANAGKTQLSAPAKDGSDWAVQVASFGVRATADRIAAELKDKGFTSYVTPFESRGQTLYRVRVGPVDDRAAAEALLGRVKALHPNATVVTQ
jgi:DedD protein